MRRLLTAQIPADFADWLDFVAIGALLAFVWEAEPIAFAWFAVALGLPYLLVGPFAGALVDRVNLKTVLILSNVGRAVGTLGLAFAGNVPVLLAIVFLRSSADAFFSPAKQSAIQALVPPEALLSVNGISHAINQSSKIAGPALGGAILIWLAPQHVFFMNVGVSLLAAVVLSGLPRDMRPARDGTVPPVLREIADALAEVRGKPTLFCGLALMAAGFFALFFYDALIPLLTKAFAFDETIFGIAIAAVGAGGVLGSLALGAWGAKRHPFLWIALGCFVSGLVVLPLGLLANVGLGLSTSVFIVLFFVLGAATAAIVVPYRTVIQRHSDPRMIGRITSLGEAANMVALLIAPFIGAIVARATSVGMSFVVGGVLMLVLGTTSLVVARRLKN